MDYEQDARDKQTYASFGGRKPQLLGDDRDALIASQARRIEELEELVSDAGEELQWALDRIDRHAMHRAEEGDGVLYRFASAKAFLRRSLLSRKGGE